VSRTIENDHSQVFDVATQPAGNVAQIIFDRRVDVDLLRATMAQRRSCPYRCRAHASNSPAFGSSQHRDRVVRAERAQVRAFERIDGNIDLRT